MNIQFFCPMWGLAHLNIGDMFLRIKNAGYDGIEFGFPLNSNLKDGFLKHTKKLSLEIIGQQFDASGNTFNEYKQSLEKNLYYLATFKPLFINSQTGKDFYSFEQNSELINLAQKIEFETGIPIIHETHRGKFPFCINTTVDYINAFPDIRFTADFSHFCNVSESYLQDQRDNLQIIIKHAHHIHARIGHPQGPQITDPRLLEWQEAVSFHLQWWDSIVRYHQSIRSELLTITPEFGPAPYMFTLRANQAPIASQWHINLHMMQLLKNRYN
jgi:sugar phosphate isomerase/epimerase